MALKYCVTRAKTGVMGKWFADFQRASVSQILKRIVWRIFTAILVHTVNSQLIKLKLKCAKRDRVRRNKKQFSLRKEKL